ncbi:MAG: sialidase family protein [Egibacteraceae bacterium]
MIVEGEVRHSQTCNVHISTDDGRSWQEGGELMPEEFTDCTLTAEYGPYATLQFAEDGTLYVAFVASELPSEPQERTESHRHVFLARSTNAGRTFDHTVVFRADTDDPNLDTNKGPMLAVDPSDSSRVYVGWRQGLHQDDSGKVRSNVAASDDGGETFAEPVDISGVEGGDYPGLAVGSDGTLHAVYWTRTFGAGEDERPVRPIQYARSDDFGETFTEAEPIDAGNQSASRPPILAADPTSDAVYMIWYGNQEERNAEPDFEDARHDILFRSSRDGGETWSDRLIINDDDTDANQHDPGIAIAPNGRIDVVWYDFRNSPTPPVDTTGQGGEDGLAHLYYAWSDDQGVTFSPSHPVSDRAIDRSVGIWSNRVSSSFNIGITSNDDSVYLAWQDTRNSGPEFQSEDIYTNKVRLSGHANETQASTLLPQFQGAGLALSVAGLLLVMAGVGASRRRAR